MTLHSSQTLKNLEAAFAGEAMANRRYLYFAKKARELGNEDVARLFEKTAHEETAHAFAHLDLIYSHDTLTVEKILQLAAEGEWYETNHMYPDFERIAQEEGDAHAVSEFQEQGRESADHAARFQKAAKLFKAFKSAEGKHARQYQDALDALVSQTV